MAIGLGFSRTTTEGLVVGYDTGDIRNSYLGRPTTNLVGTGMSIYNNVGGNVSATLATNGEFYRGAPVYVEVLTALNGTGVSQLSNGNNPGIGVVSGGGGGLANRYTGHSIFFKPTVPMHSAPIYTNYSNIGGWQSSTNYEDMGDGWFRAYVIWYNTVDGNDGKYWAINPLAAAQDVPITIYWAGPFKEDLNVQNVSQYTLSSRSSTEALKSYFPAHSINVANTTFSSAVRPQITLDGTDDYLDLGQDTQIADTNQGWTAEYVFKTNSAGTLQHFNSAEADDFNANWLALYDNKLAVWNVSPGYWKFGDTVFSSNRYYHVAFVCDPGGTNYKFYVNGVQEGGDHVGNSWAATYSRLLVRYIGRYEYDNSYSRYFTGEIPVAKFYNRALATGELLQNYFNYSARFNMYEYRYAEGSDATRFVNNWNNTTTYTMADFGGIPNVTAHGWSTGPATYTLTLGGLPTHTQVRYKVFWHCVDSVDNETNRLFIGDGSSNGELLTFTKLYNAAPNVSYAATGVTATWSGSKTYSYRPWANGAYNADGYLLIDTGWKSHTASTFTASHLMGADQPQSDEAMYLSHVEVLVRY
jgi:hypothetical protein